MGFLRGLEIITLFPQWLKEGLKVLSAYGCLVLDCFQLLIIVLVASDYPPVPGMGPGGLRWFLMVGGRVLLGLLVVVNCVVCKE